MSANTNSSATLARLTALDPHIYITGYHLQNKRTPSIHQAGWTLLTSQHHAFCLRRDQKRFQLIHVESLQTEI